MVCSWHTEAETAPAPAPTPGSVSGSCHMPGGEGARSGWVGWWLALAHCLAASQHAGTTPPQPCQACYVRAGGGQACHAVGMWGPGGAHGGAYVAGSAT